MDISMPGRHGLELIHMVHTERPELPIMVFSMHHEEQYAVRALRAGARGYLSKEADTDLLLPALRKVAHGGVFISPTVAELLATEAHPRGPVMPHNLLTDREFEVFSRIVRGVRLKSIGEELSLSIKTVSTHKAHILTKMKADNPVDLVRYAIDHKLLDLPTC
jgi:DNA-binding NarL/FixJ family response regulator